MNVTQTLGYRHTIGAAGKLTKLLLYPRRFLQIDLKMFVLNVQSLRRHYDELLIHLNEKGENFDVILLTETWLYSNEWTRYSLPGYQMFAQCRETQRSGGIVIYVKDNLTCSTKDIQIVSGNIVNLRLKISNNKYLSIIGIYRFCDSIVVDFLSELENILLDSEDLAILTGDLNIDRSYLCRCTRGIIIFLFL